jgi:hypothetical protein
LRKTDSNNPADWIFLAESELEGTQFCTARQVTPKTTPKAE